MVQERPGDPAHPLAVLDRDRLAAVDGNSQRAAGVTGLVNTMVVEIAPRRVNGLHPGIVGDSPAWKDKPQEVLDRIRERTPTGRLTTMNDIVDAAVFLLENPAVNGADLWVNGGTLLV